MLIFFFSFRSLQSSYYERYVPQIVEGKKLKPYNHTQAQERQESAFRAPKQRVEDFEELNEYRGRKRKEFEERIRRTRGSMCVFLFCLSLFLSLTSS